MYVYCLSHFVHFNIYSSLTTYTLTRYTKWHVYNSNSDIRTKSKYNGIRLVFFVGFLLWISITQYLHVVHNHLLHILWIIITVYPLLILLNRWREFCIQSCNNCTCILYTLQSGKYQCSQNDYWITQYLLSIIQ